MAGSTRAWRNLDGEPARLLRRHSALDPDGHVNVSPKGNRGELAVLDERRMAYLEQTGSGIETAGHLRDNGRIVVMACA